MGGQQGELQGPDLKQGVSMAELSEGEPLVGHADGEQVLLVRRGHEVLAIGATCTHYGGPLGEGLVDGDTIRCPWHHACFSLRTGEATAAPALNPVGRYRTERRDDVLRVTGKEERDPLHDLGRTAEGPDSVVILGAGAAGSAAAEMLRREGYSGPITMVDPEAAAPYDRPNLSKDYLSGEAPEEWIPLRPPGFYEDHDIQRIDARAESVDPAGHRVRLSNGDSIGYGALLMATGATPRPLDVPGMDNGHVHLLRSLDDCRAIIEAAENARRAVVIGASFIGLEVAASLRNRGIEVAVVAPEDVPFRRVFGEELGREVVRVHEEHGVTFHLGRTADAIDGEQVRLDDGTQLPAELVVVGVGVRPAVELATSAGLDVDDGILVDGRLATSDPAIYAAGDVARWPDPRTGDHIRVEHWVVAQRMGQAAARSILGREGRFTDIPFFWTAQYDLAIGYVGHAQDWDQAAVDGDPADRDCAVRFLKQGRELARATIFRDRESLETELGYERAAKRGSVESK